MALTWSSTDVSNHTSFIPDAKIYLLNVLHEVALKKNHHIQYWTAHVQWNIAIS